MKTVLVAATKGGAGKTTIANEIAFSMDRTGPSYNFYSLDPQRAVIHTTAVNPGAEVSIVDTPGYVTDKLPAQLAAANVIVIPTLTGELDREPCENLLAAAHENAPKAKIIVIVNRWSRWGTSEDFTDWLKTQRNKGVFFLEYIPGSEHIIRAGTLHISALEYAYSRNNMTLVTPLLHCINAIRYSMGLKLETMEDIKHGWRNNRPRKENQKANDKNKEEEGAGGA